MARNKKPKKEILILRLNRNNFNARLFSNSPSLSSYLVYYCDVNNIFYDEIINNVAFCENICYIAINT